MRTISEEFKNFVKNNKDLKFLFNQIKTDSTLDCEIRENKLQVYYRGAELFSMEERAKKFFFTKTENSVIKMQNEEICKETIKIMYDTLISERKNNLDLIRKNGPEGSEREAQQLIVRENNLNLNADKTDYYIVDIEDADSSLGLRFDMLAVRTLYDGKDRSTPPKRFAIIELKYSDDTIFSGESTLKDHFSDLEKFLKDETLCINLKKEIRYLFNLKLELGLISKPNVKSDFIIKDDDLYEKPEYIIILANCNMNKLAKLYDLLIEIKELYKGVFEKFDVKFATAAFMGYGLFSNFMIPYDEFLERLAKTK